MSEFEANLTAAELYSKCGRIFFYGFMHDAKWRTVDYDRLHLDVKKNAFEWLLLGHKCHENALRHMLRAQDCVHQNELQMMSDQPLARRTMWAYENAHNSARDLLQFGEGLLDEKGKEAAQSQNIAYKLESHKYERR